jgi:YesN/AraC family two-component response regulator
MNMNYKDLGYICQLMYDSFNIPVFYINEQKQLVFEFDVSFKHNPLYSSKELMLKNLYDQNKPYDFPVFQTTEYMERFCGIEIYVQKEYRGRVIVGPTINSVFTEEMVTPILSEALGKMRLGKEVEMRLRDYFQSLPVIPNLKFIQLSMHLYYMIYQEKLDIAGIIQNNKSNETITLTTEDPSISISNRRQDMSFHHDLTYEKRILQFIKEGRKEEFINHFKLENQDNQVGILAKKSQLRNKKNLAITVITLGTRAAMEGGLQEETAYTLSDLYIQNIEELNDSASVEHYMVEALSDFADRVRKNRQSKYSKPINHCINYIFNHLYEDLSIVTLAELNKMHPNYLSSLFKKEVGVSLAEYIQRSKIDEAKSLLTFSDYSILKISSLLNYNDQSHFTKTFKKFTGITPKQYKNQTFSSK